MPKGVYERKPKDELMTSTDTAAPQMFPVLLSKNYVPHGKYEVVGYLKPEVKKKNPAGQWIVVEKEQFIAGEMKPAPHPGVGFDGKVWAGTQIRLPMDEAKRLIARKGAERADAIAA